jgi:hypothetical protein
MRQSFIGRVAFGAGAALMLARALPAQTPVPLVTVRVGVASDIRAKVTPALADSVRLECPDASRDDFQLDNTQGRVRSGVATFPRFVVLAGKYVTGNDVTLACRIVTTIEDSIGVASILVKPPLEGDIVATYASSTRLSIGDDIRASVKVVVRTARASIPVKNAAVALSLPGQDKVVVDTTNEFGVAEFDPYALKGKIAGTQRGIVRATMAGRSSAETQITFEIAAGPPKNIQHGNIGASEVAVGSVFDVNAVVVDEFGNDACSQGGVRLRLLGVRASFDSTKDVRVMNGVCLRGGGAEFAGVAYYGPAEEFTLMLSAGSATDTLQLTALPGRPEYLMIVRKPPGYIAPDTLPMKPGPQVRLEDRFGNRVPNEDISVRIAKCAVEAKPKPKEVPCHRAQLQGKLIAKTDAAGTATFDSLSFSGRAGYYLLCFEDMDHEPRDGTNTCGLGERRVGHASDTLRYSVDREFNRNFIIVSAIHSLAGTQIPTNELFDLRFRFRFGNGFFSIISADLSLQRKDPSDSETVKSVARDMSDASLMLNWGGWDNGPRALRVTDHRTDGLERIAFVGGQARIFAGVPYAGVQVGSIEMGHSLFFGSSGSVGFITPLSFMPVRASDNNVIFPSRRNWVVDAFLRSSGLDFLKFLNVRATILVPLDKGRKVQSRLAIAVPMGGIVTF